MMHSGGRDPADLGDTAIRAVGGGHGEGTEIAGSDAVDAARAPATEAAGAGGSEGVLGAQGVQGASGTQELAGALEAGRIDAEQARAALIEQAIAAHLPADADPALVDELRADLLAALADDPTLHALLS